MVGLSLQREEGEVILIRDLCKDMDFGIKIQELF